ncbi:YfbU family protein [Kaistia adipata]|uniref:YfbU family protein n=1 Tax=Kaistia adipata TaxID=166954 RepID=UPI000567BBE0|nr:YfbU family protein [Kaistia adipata]
MAKTERFEMRLSEDILERVDLWRSSREDVPSRSEAIRRLIEQSLDQVGVGSSKTYEFDPTPPERLQLWMLSEILKLQKGHDKHDVDLIQGAILGGHFWALPWEMSGVLHRHTDSQAALNLVVDTLDMWSFIEEGYESLSETEKAKLTSLPDIGHPPSFIGFDGNNEAEMLSIARFLIEKLNRFERFKGRSLNSHMPRISLYRNMIAEFEPMRAKLIGRELGLSELTKLLTIRSW